VQRECLSRVATHSAEHWVWWVAIAGHTVDLMKGVAPAEVLWAAMEALRIEDSICPSVCSFVSLSQGGRLGEDVAAAEAVEVRHSAEQQQKAFPSVWEVVMGQRWNGALVDRGSARWADSTVAVPAPYCLEDRSGVVVGEATVAAVLT